MLEGLLAKILYKVKSIVKINNTEYSGTNIQIFGKGNTQRITIDGKDVVSFTSTNSPITIQLMGDCEQIETVSGDISISGNVLKNIQTTSGDVRCADVGGNISTISGDVIVR